ncbi:hypothetical protein P3X46_013034 [Hevea brasiliensis]|uniref:Uncharacterized protein n=1 Tax=Hevea brasiliensis TaxID=3981 RepID=A0ABQ9MC62_HEVBR|nr:hypothetical protein P3X46_013034 [Hevea brasiliensis]
MAGSVVLTFFPNYNLSLRDPHLSTALKVQIQLTGAAQVTSSMMATLHHQIIYRLQDHAVDLSQPSVSNDALLVLADTETTPTIVQITRQLPRNELEQLIPKDWLTNYERLHSTSQPIQITESSFRRNPDGTVQTSFQPPRHSTGSLPVFQTMMVQPLDKEQDDYLIGAVTPDNHYIYPQKIDGHCPWDLQLRSITMKIVTVVTITGKMNMTILCLTKIGGSSPNKQEEPLASHNKFSEETIQIVAHGLVSMRKPSRRSLFPSMSLPLRSSERKERNYPLSNQFFPL